MHNPTHPPTTVLQAISCSYALLLLKQYKAFVKAAAQPAAVAARRPSGRR